MKITKYVKGKSNKYKVIIDDEAYTLYDDVIVKYGLIMKSDIDKKTFDEIISFNNELDSYYMSIKYITKKLRSELEIRKYLNDKFIPAPIIDKTVERLKKNKFLNDELFLKAYINDQINLSNNGPKRIKSSLLKLGIEEYLIDDVLKKIDHTIWDKRIDKYISKKISTNHSSSSKMLKIKISNDLVNLGYLKEDISGIINKYDIIDVDIKKREYEKAKKQLSKKYSGYELEKKIMERLYRKGFHISREDFYEE